MTPNIFGDWIALALSVIALAGYVHYWFTSGEKTVATDLIKHREACDQRFSALIDRCDRHNSRIQTIEGEIRHLPDRDATHRLEISLEKLNGRLDTMDARLAPISSMSERMQELLIQQGER